MNVGTLIKHLENYNPELSVVIGGYADRMNEVDTLKEIRLIKNCNSRQGEYDECSCGDVAAIYITNN